MYSWVPAEKSEKLKETDAFSATYFIEASFLAYRMENTPSNALTLAAMCQFFEDAVFALDSRGGDPQHILLRYCLAELAVRCGMMEYAREKKEVRMTTRGQQWFADALKWREVQRSVEKALENTVIAPYGGSDN